MDINNCTFTGRLTKDATQKTVSTGTTLVEFDIAVNTGTGDYEKTLYMRVQLWGKMGEKLYPYLIKGKAVGCWGELQLDEWTDAEGQKRTKNKLNCKGINFLIGNVKLESVTPQRQTVVEEVDGADIPYNF